MSVAACTAPTACQLSHEQLLQRFVEGTLPAESFRHTEHVRVTWIMLQTMPLSQVLVRLPTHLKNFAALNGAATLYHETITWAYIFVIHDRIQRAPNRHNWHGFHQSNPDLFEKGFLRNYYPGGTLQTQLAKETFLFPDNISYQEPRT